MLSVFISAAVLVATFLQTRLSAKDMGDARRSAMDWWTAEDQLVAEHRLWWQRRRVRRELKSWRDPQTAKSIRHVEVALISWVLLLVASAAALGKSLWELR